MMPAMNGRVTGHLEDLGHDGWRMVANLPAIVEDGQRRYPRTTKVVQARGLRRAEKVLAKWIIDLEAHDCTDPTRITVAEIVRRWLDEATMLKVVQDLLGHAHASTTADIYLHATDGAAEIAMATHGDRVGEALRKAAKNSHSSSTRVVLLAERRAKKPS
jgi:hypothetical protein